MLICLSVCVSSFSKSCSSRHRWLQALPSQLIHCVPFLTLNHQLATSGPVLIWSPATLKQPSLHCWLMSWQKTDLRSHLWWQAGAEVWRQRFLWEKASSFAMERASNSPARTSCYNSSRYQGVLSTMTVWSWSKMCCALALDYCSFQALRNGYSSFLMLPWLRCLYYPRILV